MYVVGLTGGIGSGKSTVANIFNKHFKIHVVDADLLAREVVVPDSPALKKITAHFGPNVLLPNGELNRSYLREYVFSNPEGKIWLEQLLHPLIRAEALKQIHTASSPYCIYMVPLLIEKNLFSMVDRILVVDIAPTLQLSRSAERDNQTTEQIKKIIESQISRAERLAHADDIIDNNGEIFKLETQVASLHQKYCVLADLKASKL